jgi:hypothetical protein
MYSTINAPLSLGVGAGIALPWEGLSGFWIVLAIFALVAACSAISRSVPRIIVEGQDWSPEPSAMVRPEH